MNKFIYFLTSVLMIFTSLLFFICMYFFSIQLKKYFDSGKWGDEIKEITNNDEFFAMTLSLLIVLPVLYFSLSLLYKKYQKNK